MVAYQRTLTLSKKQSKRLVWHRDHDARPYVRERCAALLKIAAGEAPYAVACQGLLKPRDPDTVYRWLECYDAEGFDGVSAHPHGGYRGPSLEAHRAEVEDALRQPPPPMLPTVIRL